MGGAKWWKGLDSNQRRRAPADLQSAPFSHSGTLPPPVFWDLGCVVNGGWGGVETRMEQMRMQDRTAGRPGERSGGRPGGNSGGKRDGGSRHDGGRRGGGGGGAELWIYGVHPVAAALGNPARRVRRLVLTAEAEAVLEGLVAKPWAVPAERVERERLDGLLGRGVVHQGMALQADPLVPPSLTEALKRPGPVLVLDQITDPRNVGAILRSAQAFGAAAVIAQERHAPEEGGALAKAASGALERIPLLRTVNIARALIVLKAADLWVMGLDARAQTMLDAGALGGRRAALVLGSEDEGLRRLTRETCDELVALRMAGGMESLNVSAAASVALYEVCRR